MNKKILLRHKNSEKGITLIALVITVVILIILATISINFVFNGGLIDRAEQARDYYQNDEAYTDESVTNLTGYIDGLINGIEGGSGGSGGGPVENPTTVAEAKPAPGGNVNTFTDPVTDLKDDFGNIVKVPGGFGIAEDSGTKVEEGIVIEDADGNQFVWIPVGTYTATDFTSEEDPKPTTTKTNNLVRRSWGAKDVVAEPTEITEDEAIVNGSYSYYGEGNENSCTNNDDGTNSIDAFKSSATTNGGFYVGRYEAGTNTERTAKTDPLTTPLVQANKAAYVYVTRDQAKTQAEAMYANNESVNVTSQLISSYAWDTVLNFICQNSEQGYLLATTTDETYGNIGTGSSGKTLTGGYSNDKHSNIYDLLGNCFEWTTEYSSYGSIPCVNRGGFYFSSNYFAAYRGGDSTSNSNSGLSFRLQLYIGRSES